MKEISNQLEENKELEVCKNCGSLHILETKNGVVCGSCLLENYTTIIKEEEL